MKIAKTGRIQDFCQPNALLTLQEYVQVRTEAPMAPSWPPTYISTRMKRLGRLWCDPNTCVSPLLLQDYASPETREVAEEVMARERGAMSHQAQRAFDKKHKEVLGGKRDLYF
jgi:hypothetical protein